MRRQLLEQRTEPLASGSPQGWGRVQPPGSAAAAEPAREEPAREQQAKRAREADVPQGWGRGNGVDAAKRAREADVQPTAADPRQNPTASVLSAAPAILLQHQPPATRRKMP